MTPLPRPLCFGTGRAELFGLLHESAAPSSRVLVICSPFGNEEVFSHRALRHLARASAAAGIPALRFDYHGTGDSAGDETAPARVAAWISSIHQAIDAARQHTAAAEVILLGVRFGATLAALAASARADIAAMVAIAPVMHGRGHVRELKLMNMASMAHGEGAGPAPEVLDSSNFVLTPATMADMARIDLLALDTAPAARMLVIERDDLPASSTWAEHLRRLGALVESPTIAGYRSLMEGHLPGSALPTVLIDRVVCWLQSPAAAVPGTAASIPGAMKWSPFLDAAPGVREQPLHIPSRVPLFAVLSAPAGWPGQPLKHDAKAILLLAAGVGRRIGQGRLYAELARDLAARGHVALRLDISGLGDSPPHPGFSESSLYEAHALDDIADAADYLRHVSGLPTCHLVGHCSGAYNAFRYATGGGPVAQTMLINPLIFSAHDLRALAGTVSGPASLRRATPGAAGVASFSIERAMPAWARRWRSGLVRRWRALLRRCRNRFAPGLRRELRSLARRGVGIHFIFGSIGSAEALLKEQAGDVVSRLQQDGSLSVVHMPGADHILSRWRDRQELRAALLAAIENHASEPEATASASMPSRPGGATHQPSLSGQ